MAADPCAGRGWWRQLGPRLRVMCWAKGLTTVFGIPLFFVAYFWVLANPSSVPYVMPVTRLDRWIGFHPEAIGLYASLWMYVSLGPAFLEDRREIVSYGVAALAISGLGLLIFRCWPTAVPAAAFDGSAQPTLALLKRVDLAGNACPSLHVAFAVFTALWLARVLREIGAPRAMRILNLLWAAGIVYSTLAIRQHVAIDVAAGAALGLAVTSAQRYWLRAGDPARSRSLGRRQAYRHD